ERAVDRVDRAIDVLVVVRVADHERRAEHAALDQLLQEQRAEWLRRLAVRVARAEEQVAGPADRHDVVRQAVARAGLAQAIGAPRRCQRNPVIVSSKITAAPSAWHSATSSARKPGAGSSIRAGSRITAAILPGCAANWARSDATSL